MWGPMACLSRPILFAHPGIGAVTLVLLVGMFSLIYGFWQIILSVEVGKTEKAVKGETGKTPHWAIRHRHAA
jgi:hypothetical protein